MIQTRAMSYQSWAMNHLVYKTWMMFVDGENLTIQAQKLAASQGLKMVAGLPNYREGSFIWFRSGQAKAARFNNCAAPR